MYLSFMKGTACKIHVCCLSSPEVSVVHSRVEVNDFEFKKMKIDSVIQHVAIGTCIVYIDFYSRTCFKQPPKGSCKSGYLRQVAA